MQGQGGTVKIITYQTYADLRYMVFHVACHVALYLKNDKNIKMRQRRHGTVPSTGQLGCGRYFRVRDRGNSGTATRQEDYDVVMEPMREKGNNYTTFT